MTQVINKCVSRQFIGKSRKNLLKMNSVLPQNVGNLCRICLTTSKSLVHLSSPIGNQLKEVSETLSIHFLLEEVTGMKIILDESNFPSKICSMCLSYFKISYEFLSSFKKSEEVLQGSIDVSKKPCQKIANVDLIIGENKFDLNDVVVVEEEEDNKENNFDGFLKNLGNEVSIEYLDTIRNCTEVEQVLSQKLKKFELKNVNFEFDISKMRAKKYPKECKIVVEQENDGIVTIIKTLYECPTCKKIFAQKCNLEIHNNLKHSSNAYLICDKCGHLAKTKNHLYRHMQKHTGKLYKCDKCDKSYDTISHLKTHLDVHKNLKPFLCNFCGKRFNYRISLKSHLKIHADKELVCNICGSKYRMMNTLKRHMRTHTKEKPYACDYCDKRFPSRNEKKSHEMLHTGEKPYQCEYCGKTFTKVVNLKTHYLSHEGPHECEICFRTFIEVKYLQAHIQKKHNEAVELDYVKFEEPSEEFLDNLYF